MSPFLPFQAPADAGRLLYLVQRLFPFRGLGGDRRIEYPGEPQGFLEMCDAQDATEDQLLEMARREGINLNKYRK